MGAAIRFLTTLAAMIAAAPAWAEDDGPFARFDAWRDELGKAGYTLSIVEQSAVVGNVSGGSRRGADYEGLTTASLAIDAKTAFGWETGQFQISAYWVHGRSLSADNLKILQFVSETEADRSLRLWELWYQQPVFDGALEVRFGEQSADQEFMVSDNSSLLLNAAMGWPALPGADLYAAGPSYPLASPGLRFKMQPAEGLTLLAAVYDDNPPGGPFNNDSQLRGAEASGLRFNLGTGAFVIAELQYATKMPLPGTYKFGAWYDSGAFPDQRFDNSGLSLANPASSGIARMHRGNYSIYALADQTIVPADDNGARQVNAFLRLMGAPRDRNLVSFSVDAGARVIAPFGDKGGAFGIGYGLAQISGRAAALDRDTGFFTGTPYPVRSTEQFIEITYQASIADGWQLQPDFQYVFNPGGGIPNPNLPSRRIKDEAVLGLKAIVTF